MKQRSKYFPLLTFFSSLEQREVTIHFDQIEEIVGGELPQSAKNHRGWWSNRSRGAVQAGAWLSVGFEVTAVSIEEQTVTFTKIDKSYQIHRVGDTVMWHGELVKGLRRHMKLTQQGLARELGVPQQTISEWETNVYAPSRAMSKYLALVAEKVGFIYDDD